VSRANGLEHGAGGQRRRKSREEKLEDVRRRIEDGSLVVRQARPEEYAALGIRPAASPAASASTGRSRRVSVPSQAGEPPADWLKAEQIAGELGCGRTWAHRHADALGARMFAGRYGSRLLFPPEAVALGQALRRRQR
jgi:hypothetical protein